MSVAFCLILVLAVVSFAAAMMLRNLVHCALAATAAFVALAAFYLQLQAQFVGLAQVLVYVGAVAILIVFAILLTRGAGQVIGPKAISDWPVGVGLAGLVLLVLYFAISSSSVRGRVALEETGISVRRIGEELMTFGVVPLEVLAVLLTAALIGAVIIALEEKGNRKG